MKSIEIDVSSASLLLCCCDAAPSERELPTIWLTKQAMKMQ